MVPGNVSVYGGVGLHAVRNHTPVSHSKIFTGFLFPKYPPDKGRLSIKGVTQSKIYSAEGVVELGSKGG